MKLTTIINHQQKQIEELKVQIKKIIE